MKLSCFNCFGTPASQSHSDATLFSRFKNRLNSLLRSANTSVIAIQPEARVFNSAFEHRSAATTNAQRLTAVEPYRTVHNSRIETTTSDLTFFNAYEDVDSFVSDSITRELNDQTTVSSDDSSDALSSDTVGSVLPAGPIYHLPLRRDSISDSLTIRDGQSFIVEDHQSRLYVPTPGGDTSEFVSTKINAHYQGESSLLRTSTDLQALKPVDFEIAIQAITKLIDQLHGEYERLDCQPLNSDFLFDKINLHLLHNPIQSKEIQRCLAEHNISPEVLVHSAIARA